MRHQKWQGRGGWGYQPVIFRNFSYNIGVVQFVLSDVIGIISFTRPQLVQFNPTRDNRQLRWKYYKNTKKVLKFEILCALSQGKEAQALGRL